MPRELTPADRARRVATFAWYSPARPRMPHEQLVRARVTVEELARTYVTRYPATDDETLAQWVREEMGWR